MPGENVLPAQYYPDDFQIVSHVVHDASLADLALVYADRNLILDSAVLCCSGTAVGGTATIEIVKVASPNIPTSTNIQAGTSISSTLSIAANSAATVGTITNTTNFVEIGSWICIKTTVGGGTLANFRGTINLRFRSRPK
jgi:hypothetical protein